MTAWIVGGVGLLAALLGWIVDPARFHLSWIAAFAAWLEWPLGSMALLLVHALTGGRWGVAIRPALLLGVGSWPLLPVAMAPIVVGLRTTFPWLHAGEALPNAFYLNLPFFAGRLLVYLVVWIGLAALILRGERRGEALAGIAPAGLLLLAVTITFAAIDLTLSLDPHFNSAIWGMIAVAGAALMALSVALLLTTASAGVTADLSRLLLGLVVLWAYLEFMQFLIVWEGNLPHEAGWYAVRGRGLWGVVAGGLALLHFLLPFAVLIFAPVQRSGRAVRAVALSLVALEVVRLWWVVLPPAGFSWIDVAAVAAFGGLAYAVAARAPSVVAHA